MRFKRKLLVLGQELTRSVSEEAITLAFFASVIFRNSKIKNRKTQKRTPQALDFVLLWSENTKKEGFAPSDQAGASGWSKIPRLAPAGATGAGAGASVAPGSNLALPMLLRAFRHTVKGKATKLTQNS